MRESESGIIIIEEEAIVDQVAVEHFIAFLYTDQCNDEIMHIYAKPLLVLSAKYQVKTQECQ
jgi:hypothetical protein